MFELTKDQQELQLRSRAFAENELTGRAADIDESQEYPWDIVEKLAKAGFTGMTLPEEFGGQGLTNLDAVLAIGISDAQN